jgi:hypothetical protein
MVDLMEMWWVAEMVERMAVPTVMLEVVR